MTYTNVFLNIFMLFYMYVKSAFFEQNIVFRQLFVEINFKYIIWQCSIFFLLRCCWLRSQTKPITIIIIVYTSCHAAFKVPRWAHIRTLVCVLCIDEISAFLTFYFDYIFWWHTVSLLSTGRLVHLILFVRVLSILIIFIRVCNILFSALFSLL